MSSGWRSRAVAKHVKDNDYEGGFYSQWRMLLNCYCSFGMVCFPLNYCWNNTRWKREEWKEALKVHTISYTHVHDQYIEFMVSNSDRSRTKVSSYTESAGPVEVRLIKLHVLPHFPEILCSPARENHEMSRKQPTSSVLDEEWWCTISRKRRGVFGNVDFLQLPKNASWK